MVRVEMRRLRSELSEYCLHEGKSDGLVIWLEKGSYVPTTSIRGQVPAPPESALTAETGSQDGGRGADPLDSPPGVDGGSRRGSSDCQIGVPQSDHSKVARVGGYPQRVGDRDAWAFR